MIIHFIDIRYSQQNAWIVMKKYDEVSTNKGIFTSFKSDFKKKDLLVLFLFY